MSSNPIKQPDARDSGNSTIPLYDPYLYKPSKATRRMTTRVKNESYSASQGLWAEDDPLLPDRAFMERICGTHEEEVTVGDRTYKSSPEPILQFLRSDGDKDSCNGLCRCDKCRKNFDNGFAPRASWQAKAIFDEQARLAKLARNGGRGDWSLDEVQDRIRKAQEAKKEDRRRIERVKENFGPTGERLDQSDAEREADAMMREG